jgi:NADH:ubiquinone oxidoreductase subunit H
MEKFKNQQNEILYQWYFSKNALNNNTPSLGIAFKTLAECKILVFMQCRKGLNVVGLFGLLQHLPDDF